MEYNQPSASSGMVPNIMVVCLVILTTLAVTAALYFMRSVLIPFAFSIFLYFALNPIVDWIQKRVKLPRVIGLTLTLILFLMVFVGVSMLLSVSIQGFIQGWDAYRHNLILVLDQFSDISDQYGYKLNLTSIRQMILNLPFITWIRNLSGIVVKLTANSLIILIFTFFLMAGTKPSQENSSSTQTCASSANSEIQNRISRYIVTKGITSFLTSFLVGLILKIFHVELAFMFAILTFFMNFIPNIGSIFATAFPLPVLLLQFGFNWVTLLVLALIGAVQFMIGNIIEPKIMGENLGLHPAIVLLSLLFWGYIWALPGMFLAVPLTAILKFILSRYSFSKPLAKLMEGHFS